MRIITHLDDPKLKDLVIALGNFDGVHIGHKKILHAAASYAKRSGLLSAALTFSPHPQQVVSPERGLRLLSTLEEREALISKTGINELIVIKFTPKVRNLTCDQFVSRYLVGKFGVRRVFVGYDFAFGSGRLGDAAHLKVLGKRFGFEVEVIPAVSSSGSVIKSRNIRDLISCGKFGDALKMLGHPYSMTGRVIKGKGRGRTLGFPTANLRLDPDKLVPCQGVYAGMVYFGKKRHKCVVNVGSRPTFPGYGGAIEAHVINFSGSLMGKVLKVDLLRRFRDERQFSDVLELARQIKKDVLRAKKAIWN